MIWPILSLWSSSFGCFVQVQAPTAALQEGVCWKYAIMISKKIFFQFCKIMILIAWFDPFYPFDRAHLAVLCSCRRPQQSSKRQYAGDMPSWCRKKSFFQFCKLMRSKFEVLIMFELTHRFWRCVEIFKYLIIFGRLIIFDQPEFFWALQKFLQHLKKFDSAIIFDNPKSFWLLQNFWAT